MVIQGISTHDTGQAALSEVVAEIFSSVGNDKFMNHVVARLNIEPSVRSVSSRKM